METMLKDVFLKLIGNSIVASGRAIKMHQLNLFAENKFEITPEQYVVLSMLNDDEDFHQNKLCKLLYKDKSNMTRLLSILEKKELIEKVQTTDNKKQVNHIKITQKGRNLRTKISPKVKTSRETYLKNISEEDMYACIKVLTQIQENLSGEI
ncbi:MarR family transcriptional regulator [bacterium]|nr:MarR family transcriptional regulator [bacterium]